MVMGCGGNSFITLFCEYCGNPHKVVISCGDRTCPECRQKEYQRLKKKYFPLMSVLNSDKLVFFTLTRKIKPGAGSMGLRRRIKETKDHFNKLIRQNVFDCIAGGFYSIEVKWSKKGQGWNVHLHAVCEINDKVTRRLWTDNRGQGKNKGRLKCDLLTGKNSLTVQKLKTAWEKLTKDSFFVDMSPVLDKKGGVNGVLGYILKYLTKPAEVGGNNAEYNAGMKGLRMISAFGSWYPTSKQYRFAGILKNTKNTLMCTDCGRVYWISEFDLNKLIRTYQKENKGARVKGPPIFDEWQEVLQIAG